METKKLGRPTDQRNAMLRSLVTDLLWYGRIETTLDRAKEAAKQAEKLITVAVNSYKDTVSEKKTTTDSKGKEKTITLSKDGAQKLAARRKLMAYLYAREEKRAKGEKKDAFEARTQGIKYPLVEKLFDDLAPKYDARATEKNQKGGYTRVIKTSVRRGDNAQLAIVELV